MDCSCKKFFICSPDNQVTMSLNCPVSFQVAML